MLQVLVAISQKFYCKEETWGYAKVIHRKKKRIEKKNRQVSEIFKNNGYLNARLKKKREK
jgi:hypothetical protein